MYLSLFPVYVKVSSIADFIFSRLKVQKKKSPNKQKEIRRKGHFSTLENLKNMEIEKLAEQHIDGEVTIISKKSKINKIIKSLINPHSLGKKCTNVH